MTKKKTLKPLESPRSPSSQSSSSSSSIDNNKCLTIKKINGFYEIDNFDESQHVNGCPLKWFYKKKLLEKNKIYKIQRFCSKEKTRTMASNVSTSGKKKKKIYKDKTPIDVKIRKFFFFHFKIFSSKQFSRKLFTFSFSDKINLIEKYGKNVDGSTTTTNLPHIMPRSNSDPTSEKEKLKKHKKKLAFKLNKKIERDFYDKTDDEDGAGGGHDGDGSHDGGDGHDGGGDDGWTDVDDFNTKNLDSCDKMLVKINSLYIYRKLLLLFPRFE